MSNLNLNLSKLRTKTQLATSLCEITNNFHYQFNTQIVSGIYRFTYLPDDRYIYIGQASNFQTRYEQHCYD